MNHVLQSLWRMNKIGKATRHHFKYFLYNYYEIALGYDSFLQM